MKSEREIKYWEITFLRNGEQDYDQEYSEEDAIKQAKFWENMKEHGMDIRDIDVHPVYTSPEDEESVRQFHEAMRGLGATIYDEDAENAQQAAASREEEGE